MIDEPTVFRLALALKIQLPPGVPPASLTIVSLPPLLLAYFGILGVLPWSSSILHSLPRIVTFFPITPVAIHILMTPTRLCLQP